jgi:hypothetical protein
MYKIRQLIRLYADGRGSKFISSTTGIARNTVKKYLVQFVTLGLSLQDIEKITDGQLASIFLPEKPVEVIPRVVQLEKMLPELVVMLRRRGITKSMVYEHYAKRCPDGFKHAAFGERLNAYIGMTKPSMRVPHKVGDKLFIDFTGKKLQIVDKQTGETTDVEVFVAILGCSQQTFVMAVASQDALILDDFGVQPLDNQSRSLLLDIIEDRHGKRSTIITSQVPVKKWHEVIGEETLADAILDRIVHQSIRIELYGESLRKKQRTGIGKSE